MKLKKYHLVGILEQCKVRGLITIDEILKELSEFKDTDIVVQSISREEVENFGKDLVKGFIKGIEETPIGLNKTLEENSIVQD